MSRVSASSPHDHWIESIQSHDGNVITRLDQTLIDLNLLSLSFGEVHMSSPLQKFKVGLFHVLWDVWLEKRDLAVKPQASDESLQSLEKRQSLISVALAEQECLESNLLHVFLSDLSVWKLEGQFVSTSEEEVLRMHGLGVTEQEKVRASVVPRFLSLDDQLDRSVVLMVIHLHGNLFEAVSLKFEGAVDRVDLSSPGW